MAISEVNRAIALNPNDDKGYADKGASLVSLGHAKEAIELFEVARSLNPAMGSGRYESIGWAYYLERRYADAVVALDTLLRTTPRDFLPHAALAASYAQLGRAEDAARAAAAVMRLWPFFQADVFARNFQGEANRALIVEGLRKAGLK